MISDRHVLKKENPYSKSPAAYSDSTQPDENFENILDKELNKLMSHSRGQKNNRSLHWIPVSNSAILVELSSQT